jgi:hypothetical protein
LNHIVITKPSNISAETNEISQYINNFVEPYRYNQAIKLISFVSALMFDGLVITIWFNRNVDILTNFICFSTDVWWLGYNDMVQEGVLLSIPVGLHPGDRHQCSVCMSSPYMCIKQSYQVVFHTLHCKNHHMYVQSTESRALVK